MEMSDISAVSWSTGKVVTFVVALANTCIVLLVVIKAYAEGSRSTNYGRYSIAAPGKGFWNIPVPPRLYWFVMDAPSLIFVTIMSLQADLPWTDVRRMIPGMFWFHYLLRIVVFARGMRGGTPGPLGEMFEATAFTAVNGIVQAAWHLYYTRYPPEYKYSLQFQLGVLIFAGGLIVNHHSDAILRNLRKDDQDKAHYIPRGGMFEYVSGANFFGEIVEWFGYSIAAGTLPAFGFFLITLAVTGVRGVNHHQWYLDKFKDEYPRSRKAVIPFLF